MDEQPHADWCHSRAFGNRQCTCRVDSYEEIQSRARLIVAPHNGRPTSRAAAQAIEPKAGTYRHAVLELIRLEPHGLTREDLCELTGLSGDTIRPRVWELIGQGLIMESGETRPTRSGRAAEVLIARTP